MEARYLSEILDKWQVWWHFPAVRAALETKSISLLCVYLSTPMLQISDEHLNALAGNEEECSHTKNQQDVFSKVQANIAKGQERVRKRKLSIRDDESFVVGVTVLRKNIR